MAPIAFIPARRGSKRVKNKNKLPIYDKPMISHVLEACIESDIFSEIVVSTNDDDIKEICESYGANVHWRTKYYDDHSSLTDVLLDYINTEDVSKSEDIFLILPTAILTSAYSIKESYEIFKSKACYSLITVCKYPHPIQRSLTRKGDSIQFLTDKFKYTRTQDLKEYYFDAGQFYWLNINSLKSYKEIFMSNSFHYLLNEYEFQDIDTYEDIEMVKLKLSLRK